MVANIFNSELYSTTDGHDNGPDFPHEIISSGLPDDEAHVVLEHPSRVIYSGFSDGESMDQMGAHFAIC